jgi:hypothetical protein
MLMYRAAAHGGAQPDCAARLRAVNDWQLEAWAAEPRLRAGIVVPR